MDLNEIGTALREGRERKGLSVEAVEEKTKWRTPSPITLSSRARLAAVLLR